MVRIHVGQPFDALALAHGLRPARSKQFTGFNLTDRASNGPELVEGQLRPRHHVMPINSLIDSIYQHAPDFRDDASVVYFLRLRSGAIYVGVSANLKQRLTDHVSGRACRTTQLDQPSALLRIEIYPTFTAARTREAQLKRWSRRKKEALVQGDLKQLRLLSQSRDEAPRRKTPSTQ